MLLQEVKEQAFKLPPSDRLMLVTAIIESLQDTAVSADERSRAAMLADRREEKYL
jgi:hypothetical protein